MFMKALDLKVDTESSRNGKQRGKLRNMILLYIILAYPLHTIIATMIYVKVE